MLVTRHSSATCPRCGDPLSFGTKEEATGWKVFYVCSDGCGWERMAGWVNRAEVDHQDDVHEKAEAMDKRWA